MEPIFFENPQQFRDWLEHNHDTAREVLVGYRKVATKLPSMSWSDSVDEALCYGWIDGIRRSIDATSYTIRFTPRNPTSAWSAVNLKKVEKLIQEGRMKPAGLLAWENRAKSRNHGYSYSPPHRELTEEQIAEFKRNKEAWAFFESQTPSYRRIVSHWVMSAIREETRDKRLKQLIQDSENKQRLAELTKYQGKKS